MTDAGKSPLLEVSNLKKHFPVKSGPKGGMRSMVYSLQAGRRKEAMPRC